MNRDALLKEYLDEMRAKPFKPGRHDCALFIGGWAQKLGGENYIAKYGNKYNSLIEGRALLKKEGFRDHVDLVAQNSREVPPSFAQVGDIALMGRACLGIFGSEQVFVLRLDGLGLVNRLLAKRAFRL